MTVVKGVALLLLAVACMGAVAQNTVPGPPQVQAALQQLGRSPQYAPAIKLISSNPTLLAKIVNSPSIAAAINDPTGLQYVLGTFGSPIYKSVLSTPATSNALAASPIMTAILAAPIGEAPIRIAQLFSSAQAPATGNALTDFNFLETALAQATGIPRTPVPTLAPAPAPASRKAGPGAVQAAG